MDTKGVGGRAMQALVANDWAGAERLAREAMNHPEQLGAGLYVLGMLLWQKGKTTDALQVLTAAFQENAPLEACGQALASVLIEEQRMEEAEHLLSILLNQLPASLSLRLLFGELLLKNGKSALAEVQVDYLIEHAPTWSSSLRLQGDWVMETSRDLDVATGCYQTARALDPKDYGAAVGLVAIYQMRGDMGAAANLLLEVEATGFRSGRLYRELADLLLRLNNPALALSACSKALELNYEDPVVQHLAGEVYMRLHRPRLAEPHFRYACDKRPDWLTPRCSLARVRAALGDLEAGLLELDALIATHPDANYPRLVKCFLLSGVGRFDEALAISETNVACGKDSDGFVFNRSLLLLRAGRYLEGWSAYRTRFVIGMVRFPRLSTPEWGGEHAPEKTLLIVFEQGLGDTLQFVRFAKLAKQRVGRVILCCQNSLLGLLKHVDGVDEVLSLPHDAKPEDFPVHDLHIPMMTLPHALQIDLGCLPVSVQYLHADTERVEQWRGKMPSGNSLKVGLVWAGNPLHTNDARRSLTIEQLLPLSTLSGVEFFSILKGVDVQQLKGVRTIWPLPDLGNAFVDFSDTAAVVELLDVVVTVDTSVAHLCGAMGKPVWLLLPYVPDWRWMSEREDSPWYPSARLFRQVSQDDWGDVVLRVRQALEAWQREKAMA